MSRLLIGSEWFEILASNSYWEVEYERLILNNAAALYPDYLAVPFKALVQSDRGAARADMALVAPDYQMWWVVEVELAHHSLANHVLPQVARLATASYGDSEAAVINAADARLELRELRQMMKGSQPKVLVIVNADTDWEPHLRIWDALLSTVEVFRSDTGKHVYRVSGAYPERPRSVLTRCSLDPVVPRLLLIESPARLRPADDGRYYLEYEGSMTTWEAVSARDRFWLSPVRASTLPLRTSFVVVELPDGRLSLRPEK